MLEHRVHGTGGPEIILLHGGPGAPGHMAPLGRELSESFRCIEPFQRRRDDEPLSVAGHIADLRVVVTGLCRSQAPILIGSSWGAMLALAFAAEHPQAAGPIVLVGCGTFDPRARAEMRRRIDERTTPGCARNSVRSNPYRRRRRAARSDGSTDRLDLRRRSDRTG
jgi:pimeloyl-ACP methyl ester carboxylesterase